MLVEDFLDARMKREEDICHITVIHVETVSLKSNAYPTKLLLTEVNPIKSQSQSFTGQWGVSAMMPLTSE